MYILIDVDMCKWLTAFVYTFGWSNIATAFKFIIHQIVQSKYKFSENIHGREIRETELSSLLWATPTHDALHMYYVQNTN